MNAAAGEHSVVVLGERSGPTADAVSALLSELGVTAQQWYRPRDADDLDVYVRQHSGMMVVFPDAGTYLHAVWSGRIDARAWQSAGVELRFAELPDDAAAVVRDLSGQLVRWQYQRRRACTIAGVILSLVAVALAFGMLLLAG